MGGFEQNLTNVTIINNNSMSQTLIDLIDQLKPKRLSSNLSLRKQSSSSVSTLQEIDEYLVSGEEYKISTASGKGWTAKDQVMLQKLIDAYGSDFTIIQSYLPGKSRKQIKKQFDKVQSRKQQRRALIRQLKKEQAKSSIFEEDILEIGQCQNQSIIQPHKSKQKHPYQ